MHISDNDFVHIWIIPCQTKQRASWNSTLRGAGKQPEIE